MRCFRSASCRPARPGTTSSRARCASTRSRASATAWRSTTPAAPRRAAPGSAQAARRSASPGRSTATRCVASSPALTRTTAPRCGARRARSRVAGFDLTFSAPKSVSVLFGIGDRELRGAVRAAHDRAALEAVGYLERSAAAVRRGHGGAEVVPAAGLVAAAFRHRTSRAGDPQLHTHVLVANLGRGPDGRWSALDGRRLYAHARAASFVYQAVLRAELTRTLGVEWLPVRNGIAELVGVPKPVLRAFSRRRAEIQAAMAERGTSGPRAAEAAALATRQAKRGDVTIDELVADWRARAGELGLDHGSVERLLGRVRTPALDDAVWQRIFAELASPTGLTQRDVDVLAPRRLPGAVRARPGRRAGRRARDRGGDATGSSPRRTRSRCCPRTGRARRIGAATGGCCRSNATSSSTRPRSCSRSSSGSSGRSPPHAARAPA